MLKAILKLNFPGVKVKRANAPIKAENEIPTNCDIRSGGGTGPRGLKLDQRKRPITPTPTPGHIPQRNPDVNTMKKAGLTLYRKTEAYEKIKTRAAKTATLVIIRNLNLIL